MNPVEQFKQEKLENIRAMTADPRTNEITKEFTEHVLKYKYGYYSTWMGRPIIQFPQDIVALQEVVMSVKPDLIIETGIAHGGSIVYSASLLALLDMCYPLEGVKREVVAVDIEIRPHNRKAIEEHPLFERITMLEGSSVDSQIVEKISDIVKEHKTVLILLDSCHSHEHVLSELNLYSPFVTNGSYIVVYDTIVEFVDKEYPDRPWGKGNNPYTAVQMFLQNNENFVSDQSIPEKHVITSCNGGWLKRIK